MEPNQTNRSIGQTPPNPLPGNQSAQAGPTIPASASPPPPVAPPVLQPHPSSTPQGALSLSNGQVNPPTKTPSKPPFDSTHPSSMPQGALSSSNGQGKSKKSWLSWLKSSKKEDKLSTQDAILISEIRDGLAIMRDGSVRAVVMCQSINFDLMSPQEREAVEFSFQGFLNSLFFPVQIFIRSQRVDLNNYIDKLAKIRVGQENILLGLLMEDYIAYVRYLIEAANVMDKQFYVVIPYYPPLLSQEGITGGVRKVSGSLKGQRGPVVINEADYTRYKSELAQRVQAVVSSLAQLGVQAIPLNTQELIELYYAVYNPQTAALERLSDASQLEAPIISKGTGQAPTTTGEQAWR